jgi:hypothetical protein
VGKSACDLSVINGLAAECIVQNHGGLIFNLLEVNFLQTFVICFQGKFMMKNLFVNFYLPCNLSPSQSLGGDKLLIPYHSSIKNGDASIIIKLCFKLSRVEK